MQRDRLLLAEMIDAAERIVELVGDSTAEEIVANRDRRDALTCHLRPPSATQRKCR